MSDKTESKRQKQVARQIQKDLGDIIMRKKSELGRHFITVTEVKVSSDLGMARVYLSLLGEGDKQETMEVIKNQTSMLRHELGNRVRHQLRRTPNMQFFLDETLEEAQRIESLLNTLDIPDKYNEQDLGDTYKD
ncbi:MAG: 30S ribosome-binding factor RbfA [Bernardetiaceae bacterium]|nr:30S ribosome-binding factor RbfA [Bernardetiaceae bacterium]